MLAAAALLLFAPAVDGAAVLDESASRPSLWQGFVDEIEVRGARPPIEVKSALRAALPLLEGCVSPRASSSDTLFMEVEVLAAGFVDRATVLSRSPSDSRVVDEGCARAVLRSLPLRDRGREAPSRVLLRLAATPKGEAVRGLGPSAVARAIDVRRDDVKRCVEDQRDKAPELAGSVVVRIAVGKEGNVVDVEAREGTLSSPDARACIAAELRHVHFPGARDEVERVAWSFVFDKPPPERIKASWEAPTLFDALGCGSAFSVPGRR